MSIVTLNGELEVNALCLSQSSSFTNSTAITTLNTTKVHLCGRFWNKDRVVKSITKVYIRVGTVTVNPASVLQISIQAISTTAGPPGRGDGTIIRYGTIAGSSIVSNTIIGVTLDSAYAATIGSEIAVVAQLTTFNTSDSIVINTITQIASLESFLTFEAAGPTFTVSNTGPIVLFECNDGTFGTFYRSLPISTIFSLVYNVNSAADEAALEFRLPMNCTISGCKVLLSVAVGADFNVLLYSGTTVIATGIIAMSVIKSNVTASPRIYDVQFPLTDLTANSQYAISVVPSTVNNITLYAHDVANTAHWQAHQGELSWAYKTRVDGGSWGATTLSRRPAISLLLSKIDNGAGGGGGTGISRARIMGAM